MGNHQGVLYVATRRQRYVDMARTSSLSLKAVCDLPTALVTDMPLGPGGGFDRVVNIESCGDGFRDKVLGCAVSPFDSSLFLDADTFVVRNPGPMFALLDRFDIAAAHAPGRVEYDVAVPDSHPEYNTGVILWRRNEATDKLLSKWLERYDALKVSPDQPSFREAVWTTPEVSAYVLPPEYNLRFRMAGFAKLPITVLHGYPNHADYPSIAAAFSSKLIHPNVGIVFINGRMFASDDSTVRLFKPRGGVARSLALRMLPDSARATLRRLKRKRFLND